MVEANPPNKREQKAFNKKDIVAWKDFYDKLGSLDFRPGHTGDTVKKIECSITIDVLEEDPTKKWQVLYTVHLYDKAFMPDQEEIEFYCAHRMLCAKKACMYKSTRPGQPLKMYLFIQPYPDANSSYQRHITRQLTNEWKKVIERRFTEIFLADANIVPVISVTSIRSEELQENVWIKHFDQHEVARIDPIVQESFSSTHGGSSKTIVIGRDLDDNMEAKDMRAFIKGIALEIALKIYKPYFARGSDIVPTEAQVIVKGKPAGGPILFGKPFLTTPVIGLGSYEFRQKNDLNYCVMFGDYNKLILQMEQEIRSVLHVCPGVDNPEEFVEQIDREAILEAIGQAREQGVERHVATGMSHYKSGLSPHVCLAIHKKIAGLRSGIGHKTRFSWNPFLVSDIYAVNFIMVTSVMGEIGTRNLLSCSDRAVNMLVYGAKNTGKTSFLDMARHYMGGEKANPTFDGFQCPGIGGSSCLTSEEYDPVHTGMDLKKINKIKAALDITATKSINVKYINIKEALRNVPWFISANEDIADMQCNVPDPLIPHVDAVNERLLKLFLDDGGSLLAYTKITSADAMELSRLLAKDLKSPGEAQEQMFNYMMAFTPFKTRSQFAYLWTEEMISYSVSRLSEILQNPIIFKLMQNMAVRRAFLTMRINDRSDHDAMMTFMGREQVPNLAFSVMKDIREQDFESQSDKDMLDDIKTSMPLSPEAVLLKRARMHAFILNHYDQTKVGLKVVVGLMEELYSQREENGAYLVGDAELREQLLITLDEMKSDTGSEYGRAAAE